MAEFETTYRVNVLGPAALDARRASRTCRPTGRGRVVNVSSVSSSTGFVGQSVYGGTKAALEAMTRTWARELAESCTVKRRQTRAPSPAPCTPPTRTSSRPASRGWIEHTPLMRARDGVDPRRRRAGRQDERREARPPRRGCRHQSGMLCTPDAAWCTGQVVCANGGMLMLH